MVFTVFGGHRPFYKKAKQLKSHGMVSRDKIKRFQPWSGIKQQAMTAFLAGTGGNAPLNPVIEPRFPVKRVFNYKRPVYIGNRVEYAQYALEGGKAPEVIDVEPNG